LTGLTNRRGFELALKREVAAAQRDPSCAGTVIMMDLDGFKWSMIILVTLPVMPI
jgi:GGDEF domain-containing protein